MTGKPEYHAWYNAYRRCHVETDPSYEYYGGRGITMCTEWHPPSEVGFVRFFRHIGLRPEGMSLDRIDNDDGYRPGNVRWATRSVQNSNQRRGLK